MNHCEYDYGLDEEPCGEPATIKVRIGDDVLWMCAYHYDWHARLMLKLGLPVD